jgi:hypothetical protein
MLTPKIHNSLISRTNTPNKYNSSLQILRGFANYNEVIHGSKHTHTAFLLQIPDSCLTRVRQDNRNKDRYFKRILTRNVDVQVK